MLSKYLALAQLSTQDLWRAHTALQERQPLLYAVWTVTFKELLRLKDASDPNGLDVLATMQSVEEATWQSYQDALDEFDAVNELLRARMRAVLGL